MTSVVQGPSRVSRPFVLIGAVLCAALLNLALIQGILMLNRAAAARAPALAAQLRAQVLKLPPVQEVDPVEDVEIEDETEALMQVDLDAIAPQVDELELPELSFDLDLSFSPLGATSVSVQSRVAVHQRPKGETRPTRTQGEGPLDSDRVDQPPRELASSAKPAYPRAAQRRKIEGLVTIELLIDERGRVQESRNAEGNALLVNAVKDIVPRLRFSPARHEGELVSVWGRKTFRFQLPSQR